MRRSHVLLVAILCALSLSARGQSVVIFRNCDHDWSIHYGTNQYGLVQETRAWENGIPSPVITTIWLGSRSYSVNHTIWPVAGVIVIPFVCLCWLLPYAFGSIFRPDKKPPPPNPSPPP